MVCATFCSCAAPSPGCTPPLLAHPPPLPAPGSTPDPSTSFSHPHSACMQHSSPGLHLALLTHPSHLHHFLPRLHHPSFCALSPCACSPLACGPPLTCGPSHMVPLFVALPCSMPSLHMAPSV